MASPRSPHALVIAAGYTLGAALYDRLPEQIPPSWTVAGRDILPGRAMVAFLLPTAAAVTYFLLRGLCERHPVDAESSPHALATYDAVMLRFISFLMGVHAIVLAGLLGLLRGRGWAAQIVPVLLGLVMIGIGNLLPRTRPNLAIGIRTSRTLSDRTMWMHTHRIAGYAVVGLGGVVLVAVIALPPPLGPAMILLVAPAAVLGVAVLVYRSREESCKLPQS
jgi:uncharacterized membrane protein